MDQRPICVICHKNVCKRKRAGKTKTCFTRFCSTCYARRKSDPSIAAAFIQSRRTGDTKLSPEEIQERIARLGPIQRPPCTTCHVGLAAYKGIMSTGAGRAYGKYCYACMKKRRDAGLIKRKLRQEQIELRKKFGLHPYLNKRKYRIHLKESCERCGFVPEAYCQLTVHHLDKNHKNNDPLNLQTLCHNCHNLVHHLDRISLKQAAS